MSGLAEAAVSSNAPEMSVSELSAAIKRTVEDAFGFVRLRGEISGYRGPSPSGHVYFRMKDENAVIEAVIWKGVFGRLRFKPEEGLEVIAIGRVTTFPGSSKYQIVVEAIEPAGVGALMALLEERKKKLAAEGLFDLARKKALPFLPAVIGVVTSPTGAVIRDILHRLADRFPRHVLVWPVRVQGEGSAAEVAAAIVGFDAIDEDANLPRPDVVIVARGGGSLEDLWGFNDETVARAVAACRIPLISAVGHETDTTLIDFVADRRAPTPTAAAEMAVPVRADLMAEVSDLARRRADGMIRFLDARAVAVRAAVRALPDTERLLAQARQRLDMAGERLPSALRANAIAHRARLDRAGGRLAPGLLTLRLSREAGRAGGLDARFIAAFAHRLETRQNRLSTLAERLDRSLTAYGVAQSQLLERTRDRLGATFERAPRALAGGLARRRARLDGLGQTLAALSYQGILARGFALVRDPSGKPLRAASEAEAGAALSIEFADGIVKARVDGAGGGPSATLRKLKPTPSGQGTLL